MLKLHLHSSSSQILSVHTTVKVDNHSSSKLRVIRNFSRHFGKCTRSAAPTRMCIPRTTALAVTYTHTHTHIHAENGHPLNENHIN
jgi:hypothetical protein